jgi:hypothetical protein
VADGLEVGTGNFGADVTGLGADDLRMGAVGFEADIRGVTGLGMEG